MTLLAFLRHAETPWSRDGRIQGRSDTPIEASARDRLRGLCLPASLRGSVVLSSPLLRCRQTADALGLAPPRLDERLAEMYWGQWEGQRLADLRARLGDAMAANEARGLDFRPEGGESPREVQARVSPLLREIAAQGKPVLALSHRGVIRAVFAAATGWDMLGKPPARLDWSCVQVFRLDGQGQARVDALNVALEPRTPMEGSP